MDFLLIILFIGVPVLLMLDSLDTEASQKEIKKLFNMLGWGLLIFVLLMLFFG
tara:strand:+ start:277 stop:435 length:159 start_codon:yes stop_codon:yes gene_type:complete